MLQSESVKFLENCIKQIENATPEEIESMKKSYKENMKCDHYCHSCDRDFTIVENDLYNHKCKNSILVGIHSPGRKEKIMLVNYAKLTEESKRLAAIQYIRLLGQKDPENVIQEDNGFYSHTNTRGKKRMLLPCITFAEYNSKKEKYTETRMKKCLGCYVMEIVA